MTNQDNADYIEAQPTAELLQSIANDNLSMSDALGELIDNAIDANAKQITITIGKRKRAVPAFVSVDDDGTGCDALVSIVQLGKHADHKTTRLGRFGIGAPNAMLFLGGTESEVKIVSTKDSSRRMLTLNWRRYAAQWRIDNKWMMSRAALPGECGTQIVIEPCVRHFPEGADLARLLAHLGYVYAPAIKRGVQIQLRTDKAVHVVKRWEMPAVENIVDTVINVGACTARVYVGVVPVGAANQRPGITYMHGFRVIKPSSGLGCSGMDFSRVCGFVELDRGWSLTKNKNDISQHKEELAVAVFAAIKGVLDQAASVGHELRFAQFDSEVDSALHTLFGKRDKKAKRGKGGETGTIEPTGKGRGHKRARVEQPGHTFGNRLDKLGGALRLSYVDLGNDDRFGQMSENQVILNLAHPLVSEARSAQNKTAIVILASVLIAESVQRTTASGQQRFRAFTSAGDMVSDIGQILSRSAKLDDAETVAASRAPTETSAPAASASSAA